MEADPPSPLPLPPDVTFEIDYEVTLRGANLELRGHGLLTVVGGGTSFRFTGKKRNRFAKGPGDLEFRRDEICNVATGGRAVQFWTVKERAGKAGWYFLFFCRDAAAAEEVARHLPATKDENFIQTNEFYAKLRALPGPAHPWATATRIIIGLNVAVFVVMAAFFNAGWLETRDLTAYILYGANSGAATTNGEWWRLITSQFMHFGMLHLALNMWALSQLGQVVERIQGRILYVVTYLGSGIGGGLLSLAWSGDQRWSAGASGAIFGVCGALLGHMLREKHALPKPVYKALMSSTLTFAGYNLVYGLVNPRIDNACHIGGFVTGTALGWLTAMPLELAARASVAGRKLRLALVACAALVVLGVVALPRYDYSVREEMAWEAVAKKVLAAEQTLPRRVRNGLTVRVYFDAEAANYVRQLDGEIVPVYRELGAQLDALKLAPGSGTERRRRQLREAVSLRLGAFDHLRRAVVDTNLPEYSTFAEEDAKATSAVYAALSMMR